MQVSRPGGCGLQFVVASFGPHQNKRPKNDVDFGRLIRRSREEHGKRSDHARARHLSHYCSNEADSPCIIGVLS